MRVATRSIINSLLANINKNVGRVNNYQKQLATGKKLTKPSDNPIDTAKALNLRQVYANTEQYKRNIDDTLGWLKTTDVALSQITSSLNEIREIILIAANDTTNSQNRYTLGNAVEAHLTNIIEIAGTTHAGRNVLSGSKTNSKPFDASFEYTGDDKDLFREVSKNNTLAANVRANDIFRLDTTNPYDSTNNSVLYQISQLAIKLREGVEIGVPPRSDEISVFLNDIDTALNGIVGANSDVGVKINRLEQMLEQHNDGLLNLGALLSKNEDVDITKLITELSMAEQVHEASLAAAARIVQPSLMDFLR